MKKRICTAVLLVSLCSGAMTGAYASGVSYLPNVTREMSDTEYWTDNSEIIMSYEEISHLNEMTVSKSGTNMYDLKNQSEVVDGIALNEALLKSSKADTAYYMGWTYVDSNAIASESEFEKMISNTQNPNAEKNQAVRYGIAVKRSELRTFPSEKSIKDDPNDNDFDYMYLSSVRVNEPLVITSESSDGKYYLAKSICCSGWIPADAVAVCKDKNEWLDAWDILPDEALVVYGDRVYTEMSNTGIQTSSLMLTMGTVLKQADINDPNILIDNRAAYQNYAVWVPIRKADGSYDKKLTLISEHNKVSNGYLPLTEKNIAKVAFSALGNTYGWGGSLFSDDCSGYIRNIYKCFGLELARNTVWQSEMPMAKNDMQYMCREERLRVLDSLPFGSILYFNGHEMMYFGSENGKYYVISAISSIMQPENPAARQRVRSIVINTLDIKRANGNSWLDDLNLALVPYQTAEKSQIPEDMWYRSGVSYCIKNKLMQGDENNFFKPEANIKWAELLQILYNREGMQADNTESDKAWYADAVSWALNSDIISNAAAEEKAESEMTREEAVTVLYRYAEYKGFDTELEADTSKFTDLNESSEEAVAAIKYAVASGLINGKTDSTINPRDNITRAEIAVILERFFTESAK